MVEPMCAKKLPLFFAMGCIGVTTEVFYTALYDLVASRGASGLSLTGHTYLWMFPLYGSIAFFFPPLMKRWSHWKAWQRALVYGVGILLVEYFSGGLLSTLTGSCPWEYKTGFHIKGWVRLDYYPLWVIFAALLEALIAWLEPRLR